MARVARLLSNTTTRLLFRTAEVVEATDLGANFRTIELEGESLEGVSWKPGDKIQIRTDFDAGLNLRTYTPLYWDPARGSTKLLICTHGTGPGSTWAKGVSSGSRCQIFGPRDSLKLGTLPGKILFVGDETSFAIASSWRKASSENVVLAEVFEVDVLDECGPVFDAMGLGTAQLVRREVGSTHLARLSSSVIELLRTNPEASLCLTGKAQSVASIRRQLKAANLAERPTCVKAYWDETRSGLD